MSREYEIEKILKKNLCMGDEDGFDEAVSQLLARDKRIATEARLDELKTLSKDGGENIVTWAGDGKARLISDRYDALKMELINE